MSRGGCTPEQMESCPLMESISLLVRTKSLRRGIDRFFPAPTELPTGIHSTEVNSLNFSPLADYPGFIANSNKFIAADMGHLFFLGSPYTVARLIIAVSIDSINRVFGGRFFTHIFKKVRESILTAPSLAHDDTSATVQIVPLVVRIVAASNHSSIGVHFKLIFHRSAMTILGVLRTCKHACSIAFAATIARIGLPSARKRVEFIPAIALNTKLGIASFWNIFQYRKSAFANHKYIIQQGSALCQNVA